MDGILRGRTSLVLAVVVAGALAFTGLQLTGTRTQTAAASRPDLPTPPTATVDAESMLTLDGQPQDGLNRFIVALDDASARVDGVNSDAAAVDVPQAEGGADFDYEGREEDRFAEEQEISDADMALLEQLHGGQDGGPVAATTVGWSGDPDDLINVDGIESVTEAGPGFAAITTSLNPAEVGQLEGVGEIAEDDLRAYAQVADYFTFQWGHDNLDNPSNDVRFIDANAVADGTGVVVAVIDSGVDHDHPDLAGSWWRNDGETCADGIDNDGNGYVDDCDGWDFANGDSSVDDDGADNSHGTHVAGIIAAADDQSGVVGLAPGAQVMPLKIFHNGASSSSRLAAAITYAVDNGADIINLSLGGDQGTPAEEAALARASAAGVLVVVASGNDGRSTDARPTYPAAYEYDGLIAVGSTDTSDRRSHFSNYGQLSVDLYAPGGNILSTVPDGLAYMSGTSMAAPYVSAAAALVAENGITGDAAKTVLMRTAEPLQSLEGAAVVGARLDAAAAVGVHRGGEGQPEVIFTSFQDLRHVIHDEAAVHITAQMDEMPIDNMIVRGTLGVLHEGEVHVVVDEQITMGEQLVTTDGSGQFLLSSASGLNNQDLSRLSSGLELPVGFELPDGDFVVAVEILDAANPAGGAVVDPALIFFNVPPGGGTTDAVVTDGVFEDPTPDASDVPTTGVPSTGTGDDDIDSVTTPGVVEAPEAETDSGSGGGTVVGTPLTGGGTVVGDVLDGDGEVSVETPTTNPGGSAGVDAGEGSATVTVDAPVDCLTAAADSATGDDGTVSAQSNNGDRGFQRPNHPGRGRGLEEGHGRGNDTGTGSPVDLPSSGEQTDEVDNVTDDTTETVEEVVDCVTGGAGTDVVGGTTTEPGTTSGDDAGSTGDAADELVDDVVGTLTGIVSPAQGTADLASVSITIDQGIPEGAFVRFDGSNATITSRISDNRVIVSPPAHEPGVVDIHIVHDGQTLTLSNGFTYLEADGSIPAPDDVMDAVEDATGVAAPDVETPADDIGGDVNPGVDIDTGTDTDVDTDAGGVTGTVPAPEVDAGAPDVEIDDDVAGGGTVSPAPAPTEGSDRDPWSYNGMMIDDMPADSPLAGVTGGRFSELCRFEVCAARSR